MPGAIFARVLSLALIQFGPLAGQDFESIAKKISPSWVKITAFDQDRASTAGSGFFVAPDGIIVTDRQVVGDYANIVIQQRMGSSTRGSRLKPPMKFTVWFSYESRTFLQECRSRWAPRGRGKKWP